MLLSGRHMGELAEVRREMRLKDPYAPHSRDEDHAESKNVIAVSVSTRLHPMNSRVIQLAYGSIFLKPLPANL